MPECPDLQMCPLEIDSKRFKKYCMSHDFRLCWLFVENRTKRQKPSEWLKIYCQRSKQ